MAQGSPASTSSPDAKHEVVIQRASSPAGTHGLHRQSTTRSLREVELSNVNAKLANPLTGYTQNELLQMGEAYARGHGMEDLVEDFQKVGGGDIYPLA